jgi:cob(I)alamin adenosyltransferase
MGYRLSKIVTRTGDDGTTGLGDGSRTAKDSPRVRALGDLDELNSAIGLVLAEDLPPAIRAPLAAVQNDLFDLGGEICIPGRVALGEAHLARIEAEVARLNETLPPLREFVLPGGSRAAAAAHLARTIGRRAERSVVELHHVETVSPVALMYLNRLSDLLFVVARSLNRAAGVPEPTWRQGTGPS